MAGENVSWLRLGGVGSLPEAEHSRWGVVMRHTPSGGDDQIWVCLRSSDGGYDWFPLSQAGGTNPTGVPGQAFRPNQFGVSDWVDAEEVNVREYGILGDGTDEYAKFQNLLDRMVDYFQSNLQKPRKIVIPEPEEAVAGSASVASRPAIHISQPLTVGRLDNFTIEGVGRSRAAIKQDTPNVPVLLFNDMTAGRAGVRLAHLSLYNDNVPTAATTQQYGIQLRNGADGTLAAGSAWGWRVEDVEIRGQYVGLGFWGTGGGGTQIWSSSFRDILFRDVLQNAVKFNSLPGTSTGGGPSNYFERIDVLNYTEASGGMGLVNTGPAFDLRAQTGLVMQALNIEDWHGPFLTLFGGMGASIDGIRLERHVMEGSTLTVLIDIGQAGHVNLRNIAYRLFKQQHTAAQQILIRSSIAAARVTVDGLSWLRDDVGSTTNQKVALFSAINGSTIEARAIQDEDLTHVIKYFDPVGDVNGQYGVVSLNGKPPVWSALPTASATYRGRTAQVQGGAGVADQLVACTKDAADAYAWRTVI